MEELEERLRALAGDSASGATALALEAVRIARAWRGQGRPTAALAAQLRSMHPAIAAVASVAAALEGNANLEQLQTSLERGNRRIAEALARRIGPGQTILTISNSSTVRVALTTALRPRLVLALASEPGGEGAELARVLSDQGVEARLEPDAVMGRLVEQEADLVLVGADGFDREGNLVHKVGTLPLALCCRRFGKPFFAAGHSIKRVEDRLLSGPEDKRFDRTPADLITVIVTEAD
jgi:translation initiation factor 2B subunit (eIF-2B alpha/beta/delta family)